MMTRATPVAPRAVDHSAANPRRPAANPARLLAAGGDPAAGLVSVRLTYDLLLAPVVHLAGGWVRRAPEAWRWPLQVGLVVVAVLALAAVRHLCARGWTVRIRAP